MDGFQRDATIVSYDPNKNKNDTLLSTMQNEKGILSCGENKPEIIQYYDLTKGGTDDMDQIARYCSIKRWTPKWPLVALFNKIDICALVVINIWLELQTYLQCQEGVRRVCLSY